MEGFDQKVFNFLVGGRARFERLLHGGKDPQISWFAEQQDRRQALVPELALQVRHFRCLHRALGIMNIDGRDSVQREHCGEAHFVLVPRAEQDVLIGQ